MRVSPHKPERIDYDRIASRYDRRFASQPSIGIGAALADLSRSIHARRVLEAGCGTGQWLAGLQSFRAGTRFLVILYDSNTGDLLAMVQGGRLTQLRTGAVSAVATKCMARENAATVGIIGTGNQGRAQLAGVCGVRNVTAVKAYDRVEESVKGFIEEMGAELGVEITQVATAEEAVTDSDIVITMTTSRTPVLLGDWLQPGQHVNAAGSNHWIRQEVDDNVIRKADTIIVDSIEDAQVEAGDLLYPIERGRVRWSQIKELSDVVVGRVKGRESSDSITLFESQGLAVSDVAAAAYVYGKAKEQGLGVELPMSS
jgi:ornithine cyclodeaminase/alanine dehydrogenase-like protein (mu-crystallin family)